jgi:hypothetical protein
MAITEIRGFFSFALFGFLGNLVNFGPLFDIGAPLNELVYHKKT